MDATTLPTLLLGGDPQGDPHDTYASWGRALDLPAVRGLVVGRALPRGRFLLAAVGLLAVLFEAGHLIGWRRPPTPAQGPSGVVAASRQVTLVHWNVLWGGSVYEYVPTAMKWDQARLAAESMRTRVGRTSGVPTGGTATVAGPISVRGVFPTPDSGALIVTDDAPELLTLTSKELLVL